MKIEDQDSRPKIVLIGAGSLSFGLSIVGDLLTVGLPSLAGATIVLHDIDERRLETVEAVFRRALASDARFAGDAAYGVVATTDLARSLEGATYVVMSIEHGNRVETWMQDYYVPIKHGSRQVYGENGGPGGAFHTWRQFPPMLAIAKEMERRCPDAYLLNFSNPVPRLTWALNRTSSIRTVGLCHGIGSGLTAIEEILGTPRDNLEYTSAGLNHFYWFLDIKARDGFSMPALGGHPAVEGAAGTDLLAFLRERGVPWAEKEERHFLAELLRLYGYFTYPEESHPAEYVAWSDSYCRAAKYDFRALAERGRAFHERVEVSVTGREDDGWWVKPSGERAVQIIVGIENDTGQREDAVNMRNGTTIANLPESCVVEAPATVNATGIHQEKLGDLPFGISQLLAKEVLVQDMVVQAAISGDYRTALQALVLDETVPNPQAARGMLDEMLTLQRDLLPQFFS